MFSIAYIMVMFSHAPDGRREFDSQGTEFQSIDVYILLNVTTVHWRVQAKYAHLPGGLSPVCLCVSRMKPCKFISIISRSFQLRSQNMYYFNVMTISYGISATLQPSDINIYRKRCSMSGICRCISWRLRRNNVINQRKWIVRISRGRSNGISLWR